MDIYVFLIPVIWDMSGQINCKFSGILVNALWGYERKVLKVIE